MKNTLSQMSSYGTMPTSSDFQIEFYSSGEGNLYMHFYIPSVGITLEALFENYWLTYEYMYTDLTKLKDMYQELGIEMEYEKMVTELHIEFNTATVRYPTLTH